MAGNRKTIEMTGTEYTMTRRRYEGYCAMCGGITVDSGVEPDAEFRSCPDCGKEEVFGIEQAMLMGLVDIMDVDVFG